MKNYGFIPDKIEADHYVLGAENLPLEVLQPDGNWLPFIPTFEPQFRNFETYNCTAFNTLKCIQALLKRKYGIDVNYSDRWVGFLAGTTSKGNSPHVVAETIRKIGLVPEFRLPFEDVSTIEEYYSLKGADEESLTIISEAWLKAWDFKHEWVFEGDQLTKEQKIQMMIAALKSSPLGVSVQAWPTKGDDGKFHSAPEVNPNHWTCLIVGYKEGEHWEVFDSYIDDGQPFKKLAWDYDFRFVKRYSIGKKSQKVDNWFARFVNLIKKLFHYE